MLHDTMQARENQAAANADNPYQVLPGETLASSIPGHMVPREKLITIAIFWVAGTAFSGAAFGTLLFPILGTMIGFVLALITGLPTSLIVFTVARLIPGPARRRSTVLCLGALSGGLSGFSAVAFFFGFRPEILAYSLVATCFGAVGSTVATQLYLRAGSDSEKTRYTPPPVWADLDKIEAPSGEFKF
jgi:hypothetical protein